MSKEERMQNAAKKKRGKNICLFRKEEGGILDEDKYVIIAPENEGIRTEKDVKDWMLDNEYIGTVYPVRIGRVVTRKEQKTIVFA